MTNHGQLTTERIVNSEAFRATNLMIDETAEEIARHMLALKGRVDWLYSQPPGMPTNINLRVDCEQPKRLPVVADPSSVVEEIEPIIARLKSLERSMSRLTRFKLRLLNDYDFTKGDDAAQKAVFK